MEELRQDVAPLADLVSEQGVSFVTGNHEYSVESRAWLRHLPTAPTWALCWKAATTAPPSSCWPTSR